LVALQTLLTFLNSRELRDIVLARLAADDGLSNDRWLAAQGLLDVMRYMTVEDEGGSEKKQPSFPFPPMSKVYADVGVSTVEEESANSAHIPTTSATSTPKEVVTFVPKPTSCPIIWMINGGGEVEGEPPLKRARIVSYRPLIHFQLSILQLNF
jgi:hypothetical protein